MSTLALTRPAAAPASPVLERIHTPGIPANDTAPSRAALIVRRRERARRRDAH